MNAKLKKNKSDWVILLIISILSGLSLLLIGGMVTFYIDSITINANQDKNDIEIKKQIVTLHSKFDKNNVNIEKQIIILHSKFDKNDRRRERQYEKIAREIVLSNLAISELSTNQHHILNNQTKMLDRILE